MERVEIDYRVRMMRRRSPDGNPVVTVSLTSANCQRRLPNYLRFEAVSAYETDIFPIHMGTPYFKWAGNPPKDDKYVRVAREAVRECADRVLKNGIHIEQLSPGKEVTGKVDLFWEYLRKECLGSVIVASKKGRRRGRDAHF